MITNTATYPVSGIRVAIDGFYDKMPVLVAAFASCLAGMRITQVEKPLSPCLSWGAYAFGAGRA